MSDSGGIGISVITILKQAGQLFECGWYIYLFIMFVYNYGKELIYARTVTYYYSGFSEQFPRLVSPY